MFPEKNDPLDEAKNKPSKSLPRSGSSVIYRLGLLEADGAILLKFISRSCVISFARASSGAGSWCNLGHCMLAFSCTENLDVLKKRQPFEETQRNQAFSRKFLKNRWARD